MEPSTVINPGKHEIIRVDGVDYRRLCIKTHVIGDGDDIAQVAVRYAGPHLREGDVLFITEKAVACTQKRAIPLRDIHPRPLARFLSKFVLPTPYGTINFSEAATCMIPAEKWTHIALTCDVASGRMILYIDGQVAIDKSGNTFKAVNLGTPYVNPSREVYGFNIGYSYTSGRELDGDITECRVWNVVRSQEEIAANVYEVDPESKGLVAYWKFDEATGETIRDHTGNGNSGKAHAALKWTSVSLPEAAGTPGGGADEN